MRVFLLSPARVDGVRAGLLLNRVAAFPRAVAFRREGLALAEVFAFASALYFRGKIAYARRFAGAGDSIRVITSNRGLMDPDAVIRPADLRGFGRTDIAAGDPRFSEPLRRDARAIRRRLGADGPAILLGSIATSKYRDVLLEVFDDRLLFPREVVGRGDMSRGGLLLRAAREGVELECVPVKGAAVTGRRARKISEL
jgi:hypothetical protein